MATRTIGTELQLSGEKEFNDAMKGVNNNLKNIRADMARVTAEYDGNADSMEALTEKEKVLKESVDQHRAKVDALSKMYDKQKTKYGENSAQADKYKLQLTQATTALIKEEKALQKTSDAIGELSHEQRDAGESAEKTAKQEKKLEASLKDTEDRAESLKNGLEKLGSATGAAATAAAAGVVAIAAAGTAALAGMVNMAKEAAEAARAAQKAGEPLSEAQQQWLSFADNLDSLNASATDAKSALASILLPALNDLSAEGGAFLSSFAADMNAAAGNTEKQTEILAQYIAKGAKLIIQKLPDYIKSGAELLKSVGNGLREASPELLDLGKELLTDLLNNIIENAPKLAEGGLEMVLQLIEGIDGENLATTASQLVVRLVNELAAAAPKLIPAAGTLVKELLIGLVKNAPMLAESGVEMIWGILMGLDEALVELLHIGPVLIDALVEGLRSSDSKVLNFGADVIEWIKDGITEAWEGLVSWFNGLWDGLFSGRQMDVDVNGEAGSASVDGSHAGGLRYVPYDGYLAELHRGEQVLTAAEADAYRSGQTAGNKIFNLTVNTKSLSKSDLDMMVEYMNRKLGEVM